MKGPLILSFPVLLLFTGMMACKMENNPAADRMDADTTTTTPVANRLRIRIGSSTFSATLTNNPTVTAFKNRLPLSVSMQELNGNEKFAELPDGLPVNAANPGTIQAGDLMLYGSNTLVLFYEPFRTAYSYTKLGRIDNPSGLVAALGSGTATVSFDME